jgi:RNA chaperone Hfq
METNLLDRMLDTYLAGRTPVTVTLQNTVRVTGKIKAFDSYVIVMENQKQEIVYRHAVSSISPNAVSEQKDRPVASKPVSIKIASSKLKKTFPQRPRPTQPQTLSASSQEQGLTNTMKDGLLRWMQEQKVAK